jgi:hypothetical protein
VIGKYFSHHRAAAFRRFLDEIDANNSPDLDVRLFLDNSATHFFACRPLASANAATAVRSTVSSNSQ